MIVDITCLPQLADSSQTVAYLVNVFAFYDMNCLRNKIKII